MRPSLLVTVDTEADNLWRYSPAPACHNIGRLPRFQALCEEAGMEPTYLVSYEVLEDPGAARILKGLAAGGRCEIGAHLHPYTTPPRDGLNPQGSGGEPYAYELSPELVREKVARLTRRLEAMCGGAPRSMRWGRWGLGAGLIPVLEAEGYWVDSSVTPGVAWPASDGRSRRGGPAFWAAPAQPYFLDRRDPCRPGGSPILEVPVTIIYSRRCHARVYRALRSCRLGLLARRLRVEPQWLRPFPWMSAKDLMAVYRRGRRERHSVFNLMLHSSELLPGANPYFAREEDVQRMLAGLRTFLSEMARRGVVGTTLRTLYRSYRWGPGRPLLDAQETR